MPNSPDQPRPESWQSMLHKTAAEEAGSKLASSEVSAIRDQLEKAVLTDAQILSAASPTIDEDAARLVARHEEHRIAREFVEMVVQMKQDQKNEDALAELAFLRNKANVSGFFVMKYSAEKIKERIQSPSHVIAEAFARSTDPTKAKESAADCQCWIPSIDTNETIELPGQNPKDVVISEDMVQLCKDRPWAVGEVLDISSSLKAGSLGYAGVARKAAFHHIENVINPERGDKFIEFMGASIGQLKGIITPQGEEIRLRDLGHPMGIVNQRSLTIHMNGSYPANLAYKLSDRTADVEMEDGTYKILLDWLMYVHHLRVS